MAAQKAQAPTRLPEASGPAAVVAPNGPTGLQVVESRTTPAKPVVALPSAPPVVDDGYGGADSDPSDESSMYVLGAFAAAAAAAYVLLRRN